MSAAHRSEPDLLVLHALRCGGAATTERLESTLGALFTDDVEGLLLDFAAQGLVAHGGGAFGGWRLTDAGRAADAERIGSELDRTGARPVVQAACDGFLPLNQRTLDVCSQWQVRSLQPMVLNDHTDPEYDAGVLAKLEAVDAQVQPVCTELAGRLARFSTYSVRLASALERARRGEQEFVADGLDSYHAVWFQLHEDLLATLGISREWSAG